MQITAITIERFVEIYSELTDITEQSPNSTTTAYSGSLSEIDNAVITSDTVNAYGLARKWIKSILRQFLLL